ncbi:MAG: hypothetical protein A3D31_03605 [Candidatus Fluviicola riflensis]|nr:MAG: hypothetical protein CHH17_11425 [Candidatus Fluviicola riflensis]OGS79063.1 MAG: hypothetical protein A3D31_03605 [Candidatus Fluviicola riflensis]OGS86086.1 MAG: hypothetical protein A3E30_11095 [Fluviicola sp. RIFCSPHIGHO2_12_FULL_43_24]OGS86495.1 MAG: hypothetical protein A2724_03065 [Fluviicola sp. RIFCSPHIGHO2_01_FULL_43_53]
MLKEARKKGFMMVALLAVITSMFKLSVVETTVISSPSKSQHSSKTSFNHLQNNTFVLLFESDSEKFGNEKSDDEVKSFSISGSYFTRFQVSTLRLELQKHEEWAEKAVKGTYPPIYLVNGNFRL